jgi:glycosyltransferase involved in cell wall biosynthesis
VVLTYNEAPNIRHCLDSVSDLCEIFVVDSGSDDETVAICHEYTPHVYTNPYVNHASQWQWALDNLPLTGDWVLALDADFTVSPALRSRISYQLVQLSDRIAGVYVRHLYVFGGNLIRFGGTKQYWLRLIRRGRARPDLSDLVDFRFVVDGDVIRWREAVVEYNRHDDDISVWSRKQDKFALRLAVEEELRRAGRHRWQLRPRFFGRTDERFAWLRDRWLRVPLFLRPVIYFVYRYLLFGGFLDGRGGFLYHALQGFWLRLVVDWKIVQLRRHNLSDADLRSLAGLMLTTRSGSVEEVLEIWRRKAVSNPSGSMSASSHAALSEDQKAC